MGLSLNVRFWRSSGDVHGAVIACLEDVDARLSGVATGRR